MIAYEELCQALDRYNRRLRGEDVPVEEYAASDDFDIVESEDASAAEMDYDLTGPDVTDETAVPDASYGEYPAGGSGEFAQQGYDSGGVPGQPAVPMPSDQYSSGQRGAAQVPEGYDAEPPPTPGTFPDGQDPNRQ
ncbi:MAG: hypothetical protein ABI333_22750 [bacterium]